MQQGKQSEKAIFCSKIHYEDGNIISTDTYNTVLVSAVRSEIYAMSYGLPWKLFHLTFASEPLLFD